MADPAVADAEHEREAERPEQQGAQARVDDALLQDVDDLAGAGEAGLEHHEAGLHEEHQEGRDEHPRGVRPAHDGVDRHVCSGCQRVHGGPQDQISRPEDDSCGQDDARHLSTEERHKESLSVLVSRPRLEGSYIHKAVLLGRPRGGTADNVRRGDCQKVSQLLTQCVQDPRPELPLGLVV